jgi:hypothetical protein
VLALRAHADAAKQAGRFNLRRDWNSLLSLVGRHLVWPQPVLGACAPSWRSAARATRVLAGHEAAHRRGLPGTPRSLARPYEEGTLFFYLDEYIKDAPKDLLAVLAAPATGSRGG